MAKLRTSMKQAAHEELDLEAPQDLSDDIMREGERFSRPTVNVPLESIMEDTEGLQATLQGEEGALLLPSQNPPYALPPRSEQQEQSVRFAAQAQAALRNPECKKQLDPMQKSTLESIAKAMNDTPNSDITTWVENRRVVIPGEVMSVPNKLNQKKSLKLLEALLGGTCTGDKRSPDGKVDMCTCPTHNVARAAQSKGFRDKPLLWLSQHLYAESTKRDLRRAIPKDFPYDPQIDGDKEAVAPKAISSLFSEETTERLMDLADINQVSILCVLRYLTKRICDHNAEMIKPKDYSGQYDV